MRYIKLAALVFMAVLSTTAMTQAQDMKAMKGTSGMHGMQMAMATKGKTTIMDGQVVGLACYLTKGNHGEKYAECQTSCVKSGLPVGILSHGKVYLAITANHQAANSLLLPYMEKQVKITGVVEGRAGMKVVAIDKVEPLASK
jgi:hypothetical protein